MDKELQFTSAMQRDLKFHFLEHITNKFSKDRIIGYGAYGVVYKGVLDNGEEIAVKRLKHLGIDDDKQFKNECTNLMRLQHENIVRLVGYCYEIAHKFEEYKGKYVPAGVEEKALCFEYMRGGSLDKKLSDESCGLDWHRRYKIIKGICEGLNYLHNGSKDPIYHLDLKPANILLDKNMVPKIGDFGLSRLVDSVQTCTATGIIGTLGYMPPEYINRFKITSKFDVFSLGVIIIQLMTGRDGYFKCGDLPSQEFIDLVYGNWRKRLQSTMSPHTSHEIKTCIEIALRCVEADRVKRPTIAEIVDKLNKIDTVERSLLDQVKSQSNQASYKFMNSGAADIESALTASSSPPTPSNPIIKYGDEGSSTVTKEQEHKPLEQKQLEEDPSECYRIHDPGQRSGWTAQRFRSVWAGVWPNLKSTSEGRDGLLWWHNLAHCQDGDLSVAAIQANNLMEDKCLVESTLPLGTVVGVFDGHGGPEAAYFIHDQFIANLRESASGLQGMTTDAIRKAFLTTEQGFITLVSQLWATRPTLAAVGSCCLVGVVHQGTLFVANLGDSRAVLGKASPNGKVAAEQLSMEHNVNNEDARKELIAEHPDDPHIVVLKHNVWRVKSLIQLSRSIGDAYLKYPQYNMEPLHAKFRLQTPFSKPLLSANPSIVSHTLQPSDRFVIFASDGLWEFLSNQEAVEIVQKHEHAEGSARKLIKAALQEAARKREMRYKHLTMIDRGVRRHFHDDITVIVLFFKHPQRSQPSHGQYMGHQHRSH